MDSSPTKFAVGLVLLLGASIRENTYPFGPGSLQSFNFMFLFGKIGSHYKIKILETERW